MAPRGLSLEVVGAGACFCVAIAVGRRAPRSFDQEPPSLMLLAGWPVLALGAPLCSTGGRGRGPAGSCGPGALPCPGLRCSPWPAPDPTASPRPTWSEAVADLAGVARRAAGRRGALGDPAATDGAPLLAALALAASRGAVLVAAGQPYAGWPLVAGGLGGLVGLLLRDVRADERTERRRLALLAAPSRSLVPWSAGAALLFAAGGDRVRRLLRGS